MLDLERLALDQGRPLAELAHRHAMEGLLRRIAASELASRWVLRGSFLTRHYCAPWPRSSADLDLLGLDDFDQEHTRTSFLTVLEIPTNDGCIYQADALTEELIWAESSSPGVRFQLPAAVAGWSGVLQLDIAFHDPVAPPPHEIALTTLAGPLPLLVCARETLVAWKLHGLFEKGLGTFRPKDLHDIALLIRGVSLDEEALRAAIQVAFSSRKTPVAWAERLAHGAFGRSRWSQQKWQRFRAATPDAPIPEIDEVVAEIAARLAPTLKECIAAEKGP